MDALTPWMIAAMLVQGALAIGLLWYLGTIRIPMVMRGEVRVGDIALERDNWPERARQVANAVDNQFQLPLLFYLACIVSIVLGPTWFDLLFAWAFVASRYVHSAIHITDNNVVRRFSAFTAGLAVLTLFWIALAFQLLAVSGGFA